MINKIFGMIGLAMKAGKIAYGADMCEEKIRKKEASLLIIAEDLSNSTKEKFMKLAETYHVSIVEFSNITSISQSIGKANKGIIAVLDDGFANNISQMVNNFKGANN